MLIFFNKNMDIKAVTIVFFILVLSTIGFIVGFGCIESYFSVDNPADVGGIFQKTDEQIPEITVDIGMKKFSSEEEFKVYLEERQTANNFSAGLNSVMTRGSVVPSAAQDMVLEESSGEGGANMTAKSESDYSAGRVSETNVQVTGIDEPDIVKTNGKEIFLSSLRYRLYKSTSPILLDIQTDTATNVSEGSDGMEVSSKRSAEFMPPYYEEQTTKLISAFPADKMKLDSEIKASGNLLLSGDILVVQGTDKKITGFNVSDKEKPTEVWQMSLGEKSYLADSRLKGEVMYLLISEYADYSHPCPIRPLVVGENNIEIACTDIYYPTVNTEVDATYSLISVNAKTGEILDKNSFVGSYNNAQFYMSSDFAYTSYQYSGDMIKFVYGFFMENPDIIPGWVTDKLGKLSEYDLSDSAKMTEMSVILSRWQNSMDSDESLLIENELANRGEEYYRAHIRELNYTGIVKISLVDLSITATGAVPGQPLNQFSFDEYNGHLRVATTVGQQGFWLAGGMLNSRNQTMSDVSILDANLKITGQVRGLGETERIYSVRFIGDKGYVVTFRQTDPFYVLDLKNATNPKLAGELKIPGYSSYLHPLSENMILGIGKEDNNVKLSVFDVSNPTEPKEAEKYLLKEYWSEALNNHHAFLLDEKHKVFFLPAGQGGYVFSYDNGLTLKKAVEMDQVQRAIYLDDYLYLIGADKIVVLNEKTWERAGELSF